MADMEIPVKVVTTTLREMTTTPRPEKVPKEIFDPSTLVISFTLKSMNRKLVSSDKKPSLKGRFDWS